MLVTPPHYRRAAAPPPRFVVPPPWRRRVRRHRPWCPLYRVPLRSMGTPSSDGTAPLVHPGGGPMAGCCCTEAANCDRVGGGCTGCTGGTPSAYTVVVSNVTLCAGCMESGNLPYISGQIVDSSASAAFNGTRCFSFGGDCTYSNHSTAPDSLQQYGSGGSFTDPPCTNATTMLVGYHRSLSVWRSGGLTYFQLAMGFGAGSDDVFLGTASVTPPDPLRVCYATATITNDRVMCCTGCGNFVPGGGGTATVTPCC